MSTTLLNIETLADDRRRSTSSAVIDWTANGFRGINGALQVWNQIHDFPWQVEQTLVQYNEGITWYAISSSLNFKAILQVAPYRTPENGRSLYYVTNSAFDGDYIQPWRFAVQTQVQGQYLRLKYTGNCMSVNQMTSLSDNGTWVGASAISNVATDLYDFFDLQASVSFDYSGTSGTLTNSDMTAQDLTRYVARSNFYFNLSLQSVTSFTSVTLKVGTDASNYYTGTITTDYLGNALVAGINKLKLAWTGTITTVGTPTNTSIGYIQITINYSVNPATVGNWIENFFVSENVPMNFQYYSNNMVTTSAGVKTQVFASSGATSDLALWTGTWDFVNEAFINSLMEIVAWLNGDEKDRAIALARIEEYVKPLRAKLPSRRRYPEMGFTADLNLGNGLPGSYPYNRYGGYFPTA